MSLGALESSTDELVVPLFGESEYAVLYMYSYMSIEPEKITENHFLKF